MAKYRIARLPGDGIEIQALEAAEVVLEKPCLDAEYRVGDICREFWLKEGDALPPRTVALLKNVDAAFFGAITSKPVKSFLGRGGRRQPPVRGPKFFFAAF